MNTVRLKDLGIRGYHYYFANREKFGITLDELQQVGVEDESIIVEERVGTSLLALDTALKTHNYALVVKDGYRSKEMYKLIYEKRTILYGKEATDRTLNMKNMAHSTGRAVDVSIVDVKTEQELLFKNNDHGIEGRATLYYESSKDPVEQQMHGNRIFLRDTMKEYGFRGIPNEYRHFEYEL